MGGFRDPLNWGSMMPRDTSLFISYTSDRYSFSLSGGRVVECTRARIFRRWTLRRGTVRRKKKMLVSVRLG